MTWNHSFSHLTLKSLDFELAKQYVRKKQTKKEKLTICYNSGSSLQYFRKVIVEQIAGLVVLPNKIFVPLVDDIPMKVGKDDIGLGRFNYKYNVFLMILIHVTLQTDHILISVSEKFINS